MNDVAGLNRDWTWAPYSCRPHLYAPAELAACFRGCGYARWAFGGDSIVREHLQNLQLLLSGYSAEGPDLPKLKGEAISLAGLAVEGVHVAFDWAGFQIPQPGPGAVLVVNANEAHMVAEDSALDAVAERDYKARLAHLAGLCAAAERCYAYMQPAVHSEKSHLLDRTGAGRGGWGPRVTERRMARLRRWMREFADAVTVAAGGAAALARAPDAKRLRFLDGLGPTRARPDATWDGMHYSMAGENVSPEDHRSWAGGASVFITQMLLNDACSRECNPEWPRIRDLM